VVPRAGATRRSIKPPRIENQPDEEARWECDGRISPRSKPEIKIRIIKEPTVYLVEGNTHVTRGTPNLIRESINGLVGGDPPPDVLGK
jgi:hypothetical protein